MRRVADLASDAQQHGLAERFAPLGVRGPTLRTFATRCPNDALQSSARADAAPQRISASGNAVR
jgi:hypothetical protein